MLKEDMKKSFVILLFITALFFSLSRASESKTSDEQYKVDIDDVLEISIIQPEDLMATVCVAPDGSISFYYIGNIYVKGLELCEIKRLIEDKLSDGYINYPVVSVFLKESKSRKFFVYGEVAKPGAYNIEGGISLLKAISMAGGFTKYASSNQIKVLRLKEDKTGYMTIKVDLEAAMAGEGKTDIIIKVSDIIMVGEGIF